MEIPGFFGLAATILEAAQGKILGFAAKQVRGKGFLL
jgi:hypothetical protein